MSAEFDLDEYAKEIGSRYWHEGTSTIVEVQVKAAFLKALELVSAEIVVSCVSLKDSSEFTPEEHASWETVGQVIAIINKLKSGGR